MARKDHFPSEKNVERDERTGALIWRLTNTTTTSHTLYFLKCPWVDEGRGIVFVSYRDGGPNLFVVEEESGEILQLTDSGDIGAWSACVSHDGHRVFFTAGSELRLVDVRTAEIDVVAAFASGTRLGNCDLSADGREIVTCARAAPVNRILAIAANGTGHREIFETTELLAHAQFSPDGRSILYASNLPRLWIVGADGRDNRVLRPQTHHEWITHESWLNDDEIIFSYWPHSLRAIRRDGTCEREVAAFNAWHPSARPDGKVIVCDTTLPDIGLQLVDATTGAYHPLCYPGASCLGYQWAEPEPVWEGPSPEEAYGPQWSHPHPCFSPDGRKVAFTSDRTGCSQVYVAFVP